MIIGLGFERRFTGTTGLAVGLRYNMALRNQYQAFPIYQTRTGNEFMFEFDENTGRTACFRRNERQDRAN